MERIHLNVPDLEAIIARPKESEAEIFTTWDSKGTKTRSTKLEIPGYYRPEKKWDMLILVKQQLVGAIEFKGQVSPSIGNNVNNRAEEAIGSAEDFRTAFREGLFGFSGKPFRLFRNCRGQRLEQFARG